MIIKIISYIFLFGFGWFLGWVVVGTLFSSETSRQFRYPSDVEEPQLKNNDNEEIREKIEEFKRKYEQRDSQ